MILVPGSGSFSCRWAFANVDGRMIGGLKTFHSLSHDHKKANNRQRPVTAGETAWIINVIDFFNPATTQGREKVWPMVTDAPRRRDFTSLA